MAKSPGYRKFFVLQWKALLQKRRHYILTALEIIVPTLLFVALVIMRAEADFFGVKQRKAVVPPVKSYVENYCK